MSDEENTLLFKVQVIQIHNVKWWFNILILLFFKWWTMHFKQRNNLKHLNFKLCCCQYFSYEHCSLRKVFNEIRLPNSCATSDVNGEMVDECAEIKTKCEMYCCHVVVNEWLKRVSGEFTYKRHNHYTETPIKWWHIQRILNNILHSVDNYKEN